MPLLVNILSRVVRVFPSCSLRIFIYVGVLPSPFGGLSALVRLNVSGNKLSGMPERADILFASVIGFASIPILSGIHDTGLAM